MDEVEAGEDLVDEEDSEEAEVRSVPVSSHYMQPENILAARFLHRS